jgi:Tol biopolymer transport system component
MIKPLAIAVVAAVASLALACAAGDSHVRKVRNGPIGAPWQGEGLFLIDPATARRRPIPHLARAQEIAWSPDGRSLAFAFAGKVQGVDVYTSRADGSGLRRVLRNASDPQWSPDGERLLVVRDVCTGYYSDCIGSDFRVDLYTVRLDGSELRHVTREPNGAEPAWSPDGKRIAFVANDGDLYLMDADGDRQRRLFRGQFVGVAWSPDGSKLAVDIVGRAPNFGDIGVVDVRTGRLTNLTHRPGQESSPAWSPDGRKIVFLADMNCGWTGKCAPEPGAEGPRELWLMDADGRHLRQLTRNGGLGYDPPAWQPRLESSHADS